MRHSGFLILRRPQLAISAYEASDFARGNAGLLVKLRQATAFLSPSSYRGISRDPIWPLESLNARDEAQFGDLVARTRFRELIGPSDVDVTDEDVLFSVADAEQVHALLEKPGEYEIVYVEREHFTAQHEELGYDVGHWGGDHFSLIADTAVMPRWHPPDEDGFWHVAQKLRSLNEHLLFRRAAEAASFREYYKRQSWAETEFENEFEVIRVARASSRPNSA